MAHPQEDPVQWNEMQAHWRRNLIKHLSQSLEFKMLMFQTDHAILEERFGLVITDGVATLREDAPDAGT